MEEEKTVQENDKSSKYVRFKKFHFIMGTFVVIFLSVSITAVSLLVGDEKVQPSGIAERQEFKKLYEAYDTIKKEYYTEVDDEQLVNGALDGMLESLEDPYSDYMDLTEAGDFNDQISSSFEGIGAEIQEQNSQIVIVSPIKGTPAEKAGLQANDIIVSVDGTSLQGLSSSEAVKLIKGEKGTEVELVIQRGESEPITVKIVRDTIPIETVYAELDKNKIAHIQVTSFSTHTFEELTTVLEEMKSQGMKGIVLDLRGNPGGIMQQAIDIASLFVPAGKTIFQVEFRDGSTQVYQSKTTDKVEVPAVVLIDKGSASASEIVAAAVKESATIQLVGETSFGKGTVQTAKELDDGSNIKYTSAKWLTPKGNWINEKGITPDVQVSLPSYAQLTYISPDEVYKEGISASEVKTAEQMLIALEYEAGQADGIFDAQTKSAVEQFQKDYNLEVTGVLTGDTTLTLMRKLSEKIAENDTQLVKAIEILQAQLK